MLNFSSFFFYIFFSLAVLCCGYFPKVLFLKILRKKPPSQKSPQTVELETSFIKRKQKPAAADESRHVTKPHVAPVSLSWRRTAWPQFSKARSWEKVERRIGPCEWKRDGVCSLLPTAGWGQRGQQPVGSENLPPQSKHKGWDWSH